MSSEMFKMPIEFVNLVNEILFLFQEAHKSGHQSAFSDVNKSKLSRNDALLDAIHICSKSDSPNNCKELLKLLLDYKKEYVDTIKDLNCEPFQ